MYSGFHQFNWKWVFLNASLGFKTLSTEGSRSKPFFSSTNRKIAIKFEKMSIQKMESPLLNVSVLPSCPRFFLQNLFFTWIQLLKFHPIPIRHSSTVWPTAPSTDGMEDIQLWKVGKAIAASSQSAVLQRDPVGAVKPGELLLSKLP